MRWLSTRMLLCLLWVALPTAAAAQDVLDDPRVASVRGDLAATVAAAEREGLPADWLRAKIAEGLSKRVPPPLVARAVDALLGRMRVGDRMIRDVPGARGETRRRLLRAAVDAMSAGAPAEGLGALVRETARGDRGGAPARVREALVAVAELAERDFSGPAAVDAARDAYRQGRRRGLGQLLERARRIGGGPGSGRDAALREAGRGVGRSPVDARGRGADHGRHGPPPGRGRPR